ncbi:MAG: DMT family transporter [Gammaproteobacteria bacterium]
MTRGALCAVGASLMMALMSTAIRIASGELPNEMVVFLRNGFGLVALLPWIRAGGVSGLATAQFSRHLLRSFSGLAAMYCFFYALGHLNLGEAVLLNFSAPLYIAPIALLWLGETMSWRVGWAAVVGFLGVALILKPGSGFFTSAAMIGALSGLLAAVAMVSVRGMSATEPSVRTVFYFTAIATVVSAVPLLWSWQTPTVSALALMALAGFFATKGQLLLTRGYALAPAARVGPYTYTTVIFASAIGWILWSEIPDALTIAGAVLIGVSGGLAMAGSKTPVSGTEELAAGVVSVAEHGHRT